MTPPPKYIVFLVLFILLTGEVSATAADPKEVVVYTAVDQIFSEPILKDFEKRHNIHVRAVYDIEAVKTAGLVNRLIAEKKNPRCDVFWNGEILRTILLKRRGVLAPYFSPSASDIPAGYKDSEGFWSGFAARARVFVVNTDLVAADEYPAVLNDLAAPKWFGKVAMANPLFGTTATHIAAVFASEGSEEGRKLLSRLHKNNIRIVDGNSVVRDMTGAGEVLLGLTDTDDVNMGLLSGLPIKAVLLKQDGSGALLIPNTVALIAGAPHPEEAKILIDYLLSREVEQKMAHSGFAQIPLRNDVNVPPGRLAIGDIVTQQHDYEKIADAMDESIKTAQKIFMR